MKNRVRTLAIGAVLALAAIVVSALPAVAGGKIP